MMVILPPVGGGRREFSQRALVSWPAVLEKFVPCVFCHATHFMENLWLARGSLGFWLEIGLAKTRLDF
jgi:hypothetical protein